jgi:hypothetical protein
MSRGGKIFGFVILAALTAHVALLDFHSEQDKCSFGPVPNERYREFLSQAKLIQHQWPLFIWSGAVLERLLEKQLREMTKETTSTYERIAIMHAIFRGIGAEFLTDDSHGTNPNPFSGSHVLFSYRIDVNRLALFSLAGRTGWLIGTIEGPPRPRSPGDPELSNPPQGEMRMIAYYPNLIDAVPTLGRGEKPCPGVPSAELEPGFRVK